MTKIKEELLNKFQTAPVEIGCKIFVPRALFHSYYKGNSVENAVVCDIDVDKQLYQVHRQESCYHYNKIWLSRSQFTKCDYEIGANPFPKSMWRNKIQTKDYSLDSILSQCGVGIYTMKERYVINGVEIPEVNFNPYVTDQSGKKHYYQRDYCWSIEDERNFIESIYHDINCGTIVVRRYAWGHLEKLIENGENEVAFKDIVDGKQRLHTLIRFVTDQFTDLHGNYFSDLSNQAQHKFENSQVLGFAEMSEDTTDGDVLESFLSVNFTGKPMSSEHISYVTEIAKLFNA